ncbi:MAG: redoxin domain-containing protein [Bacteroidota bacterium]|nr:redoxin domain-containing protein [Bacteroidota bacterium]MDX5430900.1 redoxin domain-containing protein [Bacteroidota bacterium]MDX5469647.1 redoxin domain-containing protein [Bacteroidota bacterium]
MTKALIPGDLAPDFTLFDSDKKEHTLSAYRGQNVVILFFPLAFTSTCTAELCGIRDDIAYYQNLNAPVLAISVDSPFSLGKFKEEQALNIPLLSDFNKTVSEAYGSIYENFVLGMKGVSKRSAFVIDKTGIIRYAEVLENAGEIPNLEAVKQILQNLA